MCGRIFYSISFVFILILAGNTSALVPPGWSNQDIGTFGGSTFESVGTWTISGDGADIWGNSDAFHYAYVPLSGDGEIITRVVSNGFGSNGWAKGGVMIRETLDPESKHVMMIVTGGEGGGKAFQCRSTTGASTFSSHGGPQVSPPLWVMLKREGNSFTGYYSYNGVNWEQQPSSYSGDGIVNPCIVHMDTDVYIGLCVTSHASGEVRTFTFDNVSAGLPRIAIDPNPQDGAKLLDIWVTLSWKPGDFAVLHNVYFGTNFEHVNKASLANSLGVLVSQGQNANTYELPDPLDIRHTYYWRVDEVEGDGFTIHKGDVWSFSTYNFNPLFDAVYTTDEDFNLGTLVGVEHESVHDQLQLSLQHVTLPFIWVPNSNEGTVSKVDTRTGRELGRYRTGPEGRNGNPSRTTVDLYGNCWVGNRDTGTVVKIGLLENGQYVDRNFNGVIETSTDLNGDGQITGGEMLPWASDECVIYEVVVIPGSEGTYFPGQYQGAYANNHWNPGPRGIAIDSTNNLWAGCHDTKTYYYVEGNTGQILHKIDVSSVDHTPYGAVVDENGILWSSGHERNHVLWMNPADFSFKAVNIGHFVYGLGIDGMGHLFVSGWDNTKFSCIDTRTTRVIWTKTGGNSSRGVACTDDGDVWVADSGSGMVSRYDNQGNVKQRINVGYTPTGVSVDGAGKVWAVCLDGGYLFRIDPVTNQVDLTKVIANTQHYGYSDMTGIVSRTYTAHIGSWKVLHCAGAAPVTLGPIFWTADEPPGAFLDVFVRSTIDHSQWSAWEFICNGRIPRRTPAGCYYEIEAMFEGSAEGASPILYDLTVTPASFVDVQDEGP